MKLFIMVIAKQAKRHHRDTTNTSIYAVKDEH